MPERNDSYIERLPDCLLINILSFLSTYEAVQTSILSKRWKDLWKSVSCLDLDCSYFDDDEAFHNFVNRVLLLHKARHLDKFRLCWYNYGMHRQGIIDTWMRHIIELRPRDFEVEADGINLVWFPSYLLSCVTIERFCLYIPVSEKLEIRPKMVNLPFLKSLFLSEVVIHQGLINGLISACPLLEELYLVGCSFVIPEFVSLTVKILNISGSCTKLLRIRAPNLVNLSCELPTGLVSFENMPYLCEASIVFVENDLGGAYDENVVTGLHNLANARSIQFVGDDIKKMLEKESQNCRTFRNLEILLFSGFSISRNLQPIASFLRLTPNLVNLRLSNITFCASTGEEEEEATTTKPIQEIQFFQLKTIGIGGFQEDCEEYHELAKIVRKNINKSLESIVTIKGRNLWF